MTKVKINGGSSMNIEYKEGQFTIGELKISADVHKLKEGVYHALVDQKSYNVEVESIDNKTKSYSIKVNGTTFQIELTSPYDQLLKELGMDMSQVSKIGNLKSPMPGLVVNVLVEENMQVKKGDTLVILEAMKMENSLKAANDAVVKKVNVKKGQVVDKNAILIQLG
jgi:biotin carboxyl carrier protein